ncbi:hypothetical protein KSP39_PZI016372 [Platanthera zijinensis]|uniref:Uncharacterized protein n=1 Tax=Platanthera zijinensis TaxID=2320716 RepID=A0AAP0G0J7_9ASPA
MINFFPARMLLPLPRSPAKPAGFTSAQLLSSVGGRRSLLHDAASTWLLSEVLYFAISPHLELHFSAMASLNKRFLHFVLPLNSMNEFLD